MKNGRYDRDDDPKVTHIADARRRAADKARAAQRPGRGPLRGPRTLGEWVFGGLIIAMAAGMLGYAVLHVLRALGAIAR